MKMNKDKVIKDLRERNDKLKSQYDLLQFRNWQLEHKQENLKSIIKEAIDFTKIGSMSYKHILGDFEVVEVESLLKILDKAGNK